MAKKKAKESGPSKAKGFDGRILVIAVVVVAVGFILMDESRTPQTTGGPEGVAANLGEPQAPSGGEEEQAAPTPAQEPIVKEVGIDAYKYSYVPQSIQTKVGTVIRLTLTSRDVEHGFVIKELGVDTVVPAKGTVILDFVASRVGTFEYSCGSHCPVGAQNMVGKLVVFP